MELGYEAQICFFCDDTTAEADFYLSFFLLQSYKKEMSVLHILAWKERTGNKIKNTKQNKNKIK